MIKKIIFPPPPSDVILNEGLVVGFKRIDKKKFQKIISLFVKDNYFLSSTYKCNFLGADNKQ